MKRYIPAMFVLAALCAAQSRPELDVASVKPNKSEGGRSSMRLDKSEAIFENTPLRKIVGAAYGIQEDRDYALSAPDWMRFERFDVVVKFPPGTPLEQLMLMLQNLLADRFKLKAHRESREMPVYALVVGKSGSKLRESAPGATGGVGMTGVGRITSRAAPLQGLADHLSNAALQIDRPVIDQTGLKGRYDFTLEWTPDNLPPGDSTAPSLFTAVQEQLGLKLESRKAPVEIVVVDSAEKTPTEN
jgi:uncharacterized protein (TIGR03435 family)